MVEQYSDKLNRATNTVTAQPGWAMLPALAAAALLLPSASFAQQTMEVTRTPFGVACETDEDCPEGEVCHFGLC